MTNNEEHAISYDIKDNVVRFNGARCFHKNAEHTGDRIVMVFFNTDFSSHDRWRGLHGPDELTEEIRRQPVVTVPECIPIETDETCITLRNNILKEVEKVDWMNRQQVGSRPYRLACRKKHCVPLGGLQCTCVCVRLR